MLNIFFPIKDLSGPVAAPQTVSKIEQLSEAGITSPAGAITSVPTGANGPRRQISRVGFVAVVVLCSLAVLAAFAMFAQYLVRRRDRLGGYLATAAGMVTGGYGSRKPSEGQKGPLVASGSASSAASQHADSIDKQQSPESSAESPPPYQETVGQEAKQVN